MGVNELKKWNYAKQINVPLDHATTIAHIESLFKNTSIQVIKTTGKTHLPSHAIILDFEDVKTIGQGFADEVFRVWKIKHPGVKIITKNANENIEFMIKRAHK